MKIEKILVTTDFSEMAAEAYPAAVDLAREFNAELLLAHTVESMPPYYYVHLEGSVAEVVDDGYVEELRTRLRAEVSSNSELKSLPVETALLYHECPQAAISEFSEKNAIDLIVTATHGRTELGHFFLGSYTEKLLRVSGKPVLVHRERDDQKRPIEYKNVLVPFDFSPNSKAVLPHVRLLTEHFGSRFKFVHVIEPISYAITDSSDSPTIAAINTALIQAPKKANAWFEELCEKDLPGVDAELITAEGSAASEVVRIAGEENSDLVLMATLGWTGFQRLVMGSVSEKIAQRAPCSVLTTHPPEPELE